MINIYKYLLKNPELQVAEAVFIHNCKADKLLNSKAEWEQPAIKRLVVTRELAEADCEPGAGRGRGNREDDKEVQSSHCKPVIETTRGRQ